MTHDAQLFVPGRLCLFGEHSDWAGGHRRTHPELSPGWCLVAGTDQGLRGEAARLDGAVEVTSVLPSGETLGPWRAPAEVGALHVDARQGGFFRYVAGAAAELISRYEVGGLSLRVHADLPVRRGLSSSAAACVLAVRAWSRAYGLGLSPEQEMELAYAGERRTGSVCGRMDQVCAFGRVLSALHFDGDDWQVESVAPGGVFHLLIVDLRRGKDTRRILRELDACFPDAPGPLAAGVRDALGPRNAAQHRGARAAIEAGDAAALGALMVEAQALFDAQVAPACEELRAPRLHELLAHPALAELAFGAKGVGSGGDGCAQVVARGPEERDALARRLERELGVDGYPLTLEA